MPIELVPSDRTLWQSATANAYPCLRCPRVVFSRYEGEQEPTKITCHGHGAGGHTLEWA